MSRAPQERVAPPAARKKPERARRILRGIPRGARGVALGIAGLLLVLFVASFFVDEPMRRHMEARMNQSLQGYSVRLPGLHFQLIGLSVTLKGLTVRQKANPDPAILEIPVLHASVEWRELLTGHVVADFLISHPRAHVNLPQLRHEVKDPTPVKDEGWQQAVEAIYPLKINLLRVVDGDVVYIDEDPGNPLHLAHLNARASNIRNIHSRAHAYPSPIQADADVFERGHAVIDGHADFLAEPYLGIHATYAIRDVPLARLRPMIERSNLVVKGGMLSSTGEIEYAPRTEFVDVRNLRIDRLQLDYLHTLATAGNERTTSRTRPAFCSRSGASGSSTARSVSSTRPTCRRTGRSSRT
jgi:hypothetical protein